MSNKIQVQQQTQIQKNIIIQQEQQYYVFQDLENVLNCLSDVVTAIELFDNQQDKGYLPLAINKLILQINVSNGIHYDIFDQHRNDQRNLNNLIGEKQKAKAIFQKLLSENFCIENEEVQKLCGQYLQVNLSDQPLINQLPLNKINQKGNFNQQALQQIINGTRAVENQLQNVQNGNYQPPTIDDLQAKITDRRQLCKAKLIQNFKIQPQEKQVHEQKETKISKPGKQQLSEQVLIPAAGKETEEDLFDVSDDEDKNKQIKKKIKIK